MVGSGSKRLLIKLSTPDCTVTVEQSFVIRPRVGSRSGFSRDGLAADGRDIVHVAVGALDAAGGFVPIAGNAVSSGPLPGRMGCARLSSTPGWWLPS